jgi:cytochrome c oxidase subunit 2
MDKYYGWWLPIDISTHGASIDRLIIVVHIFMLILFIGWSSFFLYTLFRFRSRGGRKAETHPTHFKIPTYLEVGVAVFEIFLLAAFSFPIWNQYRQQPPDESKALHVRIVAEQFAWNVHYSGKDRIFGRTDPTLVSSSNPVGLDRDNPAAKDDIVTINQFHIPVNTPVIVTLTSKDVIHGFFLPVMRVKYDVIPGQSYPVWFEATRTGEFEIACAQLCGLGHYRMKGYFVVDTPEKFEAFLKEQQA